MHHSIRYLWLVLLLFNASLSVGQSNRFSVKKPMLTLTNPVSGITITFHDPAFTDNPLSRSVWRQLTVRIRDSTYTLKLKPTEGYLMNKPNRLWSPDGRYVSLYYLYNVHSKDDYSRQVLTFLDAEVGETVEFTTKDGDSLSELGSFSTWVAGKPHTVRTNTGKEAQPD